MAEYNLLDPGTVTRVISEITSSENRDRKLQTYSAWRVFSGEVRPFVENEVQRLLPTSWAQMRISDISVSHKVVKKLAQAYKESPLRRLQDETESQDMTELYDKMDADEKWADFDDIRTLNRYALMWINLNDDVGLQFIPMWPYTFDTVRDKNTGELDMVILQYPGTDITKVAPNHRTVSDNSGLTSGSNPDGINQLIGNHPSDSAADTRTFVMWTRQNHIIVLAEVDEAGGLGSVKSIDYVQNPFNPMMENPLGVIPFIYSSTDDGGNTQDYPLRNPITEQTVFYNVLKSDELSSASLQGYGIRVLSGTEESLKKIQKMHEGLVTATKLPQPEEPGQPATTLDFVNPSPDLEGQRGSYDSYLEGVLSQHGISSGQGLKTGGQEFSSGLDRLLSNADVQDIVKDHQDDYGRDEKRAFEIIKAWQNEVIREIKFSDDSHLEIKYPRPKVLISDKETLENIAKQMDLGLITIEEAMMIMDPNLTEEQAKDKAADIEEKKAEKMAAFQKSIGTPDPVVESNEEDDEDDSPF